jgi:hypothetical protein
LLEEPPTKAQAQLAPARFRLGGKSTKYQKLSGTMSAMFTLRRAIE